MQRYQRQVGLVDASQLAPATVIGVGAVGRQVARHLAIMGTPQIQLIDFDTVEEVNLGAQGYREADQGQLKVNATAAELQALNATVEVSCIPDRWRPAFTTHPVVFCCVDKINIRELIWNKESQRCALWLDARMLGESLRVLAAWDAETQAHYETTLFPQAEAQRGSCTARTTIYAAEIAAGLLVATYAKWSRGVPNDPDLMLSLTTNELNVLSG